MTRKNRFPFWLAAAACLFLGSLPDAFAGRINVNLTHGTATGTGLDGTAVLGGGSWNRINHAQAGLDNALVNSNGSATSATVKDAAAPGGENQANGNAVQSEAWGFDVNLTVSGLIANQLYKVAVYSDRVGTFGPDPDLFEVNGANKPLPKPGAAITALPGVANVDYAFFLTNASVTGTITIKAPWMAGFQIEGLLAGEAGPQPDARISDRASKAGKGDGVYASKPRKSQTLTQETKGKRPRRFFIRVENDDREIDQFFLMGSWGRKKARVKLIDLDGGGNVTAQVVAQNYRYLLDGGAKRQFKAVVKPKKKKRSKLKVRISAAPSTRAESRRDLVMAVTKVPGK